MATDNESNGWTRQEETNRYLQDHRILELFNNLTASLIFNRPAEPKKYMIETLEKLQKAKNAKRDAPCLFDDSNIQSVYGMLDPTNRGYITLKQYSEALLTLGIKDYSEKPEGAADNRITFETFLQEAYVAAASAPIHAFLEFLLPVLCTIFFLSHWLLSHITIVKTMVSGERGMNPVTMTIINPQKEIG